MSAVSDAQSTYVGHGPIVREYTSDLKQDATATDAYGPEDGFATKADATTWVAAQHGDKASVIVNQGERYVPLHVTGDGSTITGDVTHVMSTGKVTTSWTDTETQRIDRFAWWNDSARAVVTSDGRSISASKHGDVHATEQHGNGVEGGIVGASLLGLGGAGGVLLTYGQSIEHSGGKVAAAAAGAAIAAGAIGYLGGWAIGKQIG